MTTQIRGSCEILDYILLYMSSSSYKWLLRIIISFVFSLWIINEFLPEILGKTLFAVHSFNYNLSSVHMYNCPIHTCLVPAKRERAWKSPHARKARRGGEREKYSRGKLETTQKQTNIRNVFFPDTASFHTYPVHPQLFEPIRVEIFE